MTIERPDVPFGMPSPEALEMATAAIRRRYVLPETMERPEVRSECLRLAYMIQAYGLASMKPGPNFDVPKVTGGSTTFQPASSAATRASRQHRRYVKQDSRTPELVDA